MNLNKYEGELHTYIVWELTDERNKFNILNTLRTSRDCLDYTF